MFAHVSRECRAAWASILSSAWRLIRAGFLLGLFFTLKMDAICFTETSADFQCTTLWYIPEDGILQDLLRISHQNLSA
jgi:hypothetical protein